MAKVEITAGEKFDGTRWVCTAHYPLLVDMVSEAFDTIEEADAFRIHHLSKGANVGYQQWCWIEHRSDCGFWTTNASEANRSPDAPSTC